MPNNNNVNFIESNQNQQHPPLYCKICDVRMMFMLTGRLAQKYLCGMCGYTVDPNEADESDEFEDDEDDEFYSKYEDGLRSVDDDNDDVGGANNKYESMIVQSNNDSFKQSSIKAESRRPQMTSQRQQYQQQQSSDDWAYQDMKRDIEADGQRRIIEINDDSNSSRVNKIRRPTTY